MPEDRRLLDLMEVFGEARRHLAWEMIEGYAENELSEQDRKAAREHIESCLYCAAVIRNFEDFRLELANCPPKRFTPTVTLAVRQKVLARLGSVWRRSSRWVIPVSMMGATVAVLLFFRMMRPTRALNEAVAAKTGESFVKSVAQGDARARQPDQFRVTQGPTVSGTQAAPEIDRQLIGTTSLRETSSELSNDDGVGTTQPTLSDLRRRYGF